MVRRLSPFPALFLPSGSKVISDILLPMSERADTQWENWGNFALLQPPSAARNLPTLAHLSAFDGWSCVDKQEHQIWVDNNSLKHVESFFKGVLIWIFLRVSTFDQCTLKCFYMLVDIVPWLIRKKTNEYHFACYSIANSSSLMIDFFQIIKKMRRDIG